MNKTIKGLQKKIKQYKKYIVLSKKEMAHINDILGMTTEEICQKYGYKRDDAIFHSTIFPNGIEARIYLRIINEKGWIPITDITLFKDGKELVHETEVDARYEGEWRIEYEGIEYIVNIIEKNEEEFKAFQIEYKKFLEESDKIWINLMKSNKKNCKRFTRDELTKKDEEREEKASWDKNFMFGFFGNGISICDLKENDFIGHISDAGHLVWYEGANPSAEVIATAKEIAKENEFKYDLSIEKLFAMKEDTPLAKNNKQYYIGKIYEEYLNKCSLNELKELKKMNFKSMECSIRYLKGLLKANHKI